MIGLQQKRDRGHAPFHSHDDDCACGVDDNVQVSPNQSQESGCWEVFRCSPEVTPEEQYDQGNGRADLEDCETRPSASFNLDTLCIDDFVAWTEFVELFANAIEAFAKDDKAKQR